MHSEYHYIGPRQMCMGLRYNQSCHCMVDSSIVCIVFMLSVYKMFNELANLHGPREHKRTTPTNRREQTLWPVEDLDACFLMSKHENEPLVDILHIFIFYTISGDLGSVWRKDE
uniref:Uncharacterized protein n=1 Tax=Aegilops tauschii subsp. strangulata TaxID=200361 RepID=A0A453AIV4_AEGTS